MGVVEENGPGAGKFSVGQRVVGVPWEASREGAGTWQQYLLASEKFLVSWLPSLAPWSSLLAPWNPACLSSTTPGLCPWQQRVRWRSASNLGCSPGM